VCDQAKSLACAASCCGSPESGATHSSPSPARNRQEARKASSPETGENPNDSSCEETADPTLRAAPSKGVNQRSPRKRSSGTERSSGCEGSSRNAAAVRVTLSCRATPAASCRPGGLSE